jgi:hypothetical protein
MCCCFALPFSGKPLEAPTLIEARLWARLHYPCCLFEAVWSMRTAAAAMLPHGALNSSPSEGSVPWLHGGRV